MEKHAVKVTPKEGKRLIAIVTKGRNKAAYIQRAHIVLKRDEGKTDREISDLLYISEQTIRRTRRRFWEDGLEAALEEKGRPKRDGALNDRHKRTGWPWRVATHRVGATGGTPGGPTRQR